MDCSPSVILYLLPHFIILLNTKMVGGTVTDWLGGNYFRLGMGKLPRPKRNTLGRRRRSISADADDLCRPLHLPLNSDGNTSAPKRLAAAFFVYGRK